MPSAIDFLISAQYSTGGWGYLTGHQPVVEPTAMVLLAIRNDPIARDSFQKGINWLLSCQNLDGGWGINGQDHESGWQTAWALFVLKITRLDPAAMNKAFGWLLTVATAEVSKEEFLDEKLPQRNNIGALAWPWLPGQVSWTEPTALAVLALQGTSDTPLAGARMQAARDYFERYRTPSGGWNVGNAGALDTIVFPRAYPTALVLLALAGVAPESIISSDLTALQQDLARDPSTLAQAAGLFALQAYGKNDNHLTGQLNSRQQPDGSWDHNLLFTAWAMIALRGTW